MAIVKTSAARRWTDFRYHASVFCIVTIGALVLGAMLLCVELLAARPMHDNLIQVYQPSRVTIVTLHSGGGLETCGYYRAGTDQSRWRYLNNDAGLWAEGLSKQWKIPSVYSLAAADLNNRWQKCMAHVGGRGGGGFPWIMDAMTVAFLNATTKSSG